MLVAQGLRLWRAWWSLRALKGKQYVLTYQVELRASSSRPTFTQAALASSPTVTFFSTPLVRPLLKMRGRERASVSPLCQPSYHLGQELWQEDLLGRPQTCSKDCVVLMLVLEFLFLFVVVVCFFPQVLLRNN